MPEASRGRLAWAVSLALHAVAIGSAIWWLERVLPQPKAQETPVPLELSMLAAPSAPASASPSAPAQAEAVEQQDAPVEPVFAEVADEPPPQPVPLPTPEPLLPEPKPEPKPTLPKPRPPQKNVTKPKPQPKPVQVESQTVVDMPQPAVAESAPAQVAAPMPLAPVATLVPARDTQDEDRYKALVRSKVDAHKHYPRLARRMGEEGRVVVEFSVDASGAVSGVQIRQSSGSERLDEAALQAVRDAAPFPPFPDGVARTRWHFTLPLSFSLDS